MVTSDVEQTILQHSPMQAYNQAAVDPLSLPPHVAMHKHICTSHIRLVKPEFRLSHSEVWAQ